MSKQETLQRMRESGVVAVLRGADADVTVDIAEALAEGGVTALELTADTPGVMSLIEEVGDALDDTDVIVGAGTVLDEETARAAILAGAEFVVSPSFHAEVVETCNRYGVPVAPGVATPTEAVEAYQAGADMVKLFPASCLGPDFLASIKGPLGQIPIMPTGGIGPDNAGDFIEAGAECVGAGGSLVDDEAVANEDFDMIAANAEAMVQAVQDAR
ncbi:bifunctional 4-hydroxy-2-oxoglutarate aldolase/2-dehydro-3-deoxy-phosphogluconate aldolase [Halostella sp. PRR32]|uniref:bifunctional 4-hydroxy-2-oxoglutarate aldolase/2-dehydro-3-deoxy-phosphogluconate aldolase n=1 Tax=Halostella sp. PRR32 TaxID=3098147 RepID=UPI002B1E0EA9|nr:bifunctional 4-hydroxy-2-oxoglutarate aldolase/2-dehydro-3-deoxy-phosphogluconate aldolase [Halostella sp. PRR32]